MSNPADPPPANQGFGTAPNTGYGAAPAGQGFPPPPPGQPGQPPYPQARGQAPYSQAPGQAAYPPAPGQAAYPQAPGQAAYPPAPGQAAYPQAPGQAPNPPAAEPKKKSAVGRFFLRLGGALLVALVIFGVKSAFFSATDKAKDAAVGDCIAASKEVKGNEETDASAKVVDCASADAAFTVVGRVNGETDTKSKSCDKFFKENEEFYVYAADNGATGYLLCLKPKS